MQLMSILSSQTNTVYIALKVLYIFWFSYCDLKNEDLKLTFDQYNLMSSSCRIDLTVL